VMVTAFATVNWAISGRIRPRFRGSEGDPDGWSGSRRSRRERRWTRWTPRVGWWGVVPWYPWYSMVPMVTACEKTSLY
jgi:hypothetical protein